MDNEKPGVGLTDFMKRPVPIEPGGNYRKGAMALKAACWYGFLWTCFMVGLLVLIGIGSVLGAAAIGAFIDTLLPGDDPTGVLTSGAIGALILVSALAMASIFATVGFLLVAWGSRTYAAWLDMEPTAPGSAQAIGIAMVIIAGLELLMTVFTAILDIFFFWPVMVIGILLIVHAKNENTLQAFRDAKNAEPAGGVSAEPV